MGMDKRPVFIRDATGLVRSFNWLDALIISLAVTGPTYFGVASQIGFVAPGEPGADFTLSALIGVLFMVPLGIVYYLFAVSMPRSGGDYIWMGRSLNPAVGFVAGWGMWLSFIFLLAGGTTSWAAVVYPVFFVTMGYAWHNPGWVNYGTSFASVPINIFVGAMVCVLLGVLITAFGPKIYSRIMIILAAIVFLGTLLFLGIVITTSNSAFQADFNNAGLGLTYNGIIANATAAKWTYQPVTTSITLLSIPFGVLLFNGFNYSVYAAGEMKNIKRSMLWGVLIALLICGVIDIIGLYFSVNMVGYQFNQAAFYLNSLGQSPFGVAPWLAVFVPLVVGNPYVATFLQLGWLLFYIWWAAALILTISRYIFAFSFDRMLPTMFADVNARFRFPLKATALTVVLGALFIYFATYYSSFIGAVLNSTAIWAIVWVVVGIAAIVFANKKKDLVATLPGGSALMTVFGVLTIIAFAITFYFAATTPAIGPFTSNAVIVLALIFGSGIVIYFARLFYFRSKGIDLNYTLSEIPPE